MPIPHTMRDGEEEWVVYGNEIVNREEAAHAARDYSRLFGANKNLYRAIPSIQIGRAHV